MRQFRPEIETLALCATSLGRAPDRAEQHGNGPEYGQRPGGEGRGGQQRGGAKQADHARRRAPIVTDQELEDGGAHSRGHQAGSTAGWAPARRSARIISQEEPRSTSATAGSAASPPGQEAPAPSAPQKTPNVVSRMPTMNF